MNAFDKDIAALSSAEDFFRYFGIVVDAQIVAASRLHILKQFHDNLASIDGLGAQDDEAKRSHYREQLILAYQRFVAGTALTERVFPKLAQAQGAFVALSALTLPPKPGTAT